MAFFFRGPRRQVFVAGVGVKATLAGTPCLSMKIWVPQVRGPHGQVFVRGVEIRIFGPGKAVAPPQAADQREAGGPRPGK